MKAKLYFPLEVNMINGKKESKLIEAFGPKGFGTYIMVLTELRHSPSYQCALSTIKGTARRCKITQKLLEQVLYDFDLFEITREEDGTENISSPYINRVMKVYEERLKKLAEAGKKGYDKVNRKSNGQFTASGGALDKDKDKDKDNTTTSTTEVVKEEEQSVFNSDRYAGSELKLCETQICFS